MNLKTQIHIIYFNFVRGRGIFKILLTGVSLAFLFLFLWGIWEIDAFSMTFNTGETYGADTESNDLSSPIDDNNINSWIIYDSQPTEEIFADVSGSEDTLTVMATTIRPSSWMDQYGGISVSNESERVFDIEELLAAGSDISIVKGNGPQVLIVHTHGTESYNEGSLGKYSDSDYLRSTDTTKNMIAIGDIIEKILVSRGYSVVHDETMHDDGNYSGSYASSRKSIKKYLEEYPSIKIVLDVHRDTVITEEGVKYRTIWEYGGKSAAQVMILLGAGGSKYENEHWQENLKLSLLIQESAEKKYPDLMRPTLMRSSLYNQDLSCGGILVEVGTCGNTFEEAALGAQCFTECLVDVLNSLSEGD